jgi:hypothetical protein
MWLCARVLCLSVLGLMLLACRDVVVSSGSGTESVGVGASNSSGGVPTSVAKGPESPLCESFCAVASNCLDSCRHACEEYQIAPCESEGAALVACLTSGYDPMACNATGCDQETQALTQCRSKVPQHCAGGGGGSSDADCDFTAQCPGGDERTICVIQEGTAQCDCYLNYLLVGSCSAAIPISSNPNDDAGAKACDLQTSCCAQFFGT